MNNIETRTASVDVRNVFTVNFKQVFHTGLSHYNTVNKHMFKLSNKENNNSRQNVLKVNNKDTRTMLVTFFSFLFCRCSSDYASVFITDLDLTSDTLIDWKSGWVFSIERHNNAKWTKEQSFNDFNVLSAP